MKVLMISTDNRIFDHLSDVQNRMKDYRSLVDELNIIVCSKNDKQIDLGSNIKVFSTNSKNKIFYFWDAIKIAKNNIKSQINLVTSQDPFETGLAGYFIARRLKSKLQLQIHTDFLSPYFAKESLKNKVRVLIAKYLLPKANNIRVVSERIRQSLKSYDLRLTTISVLPIFVDVEKIKSAPINIDLHKKYPEFDFIILMTSRLEKEKNIKLAIRAMEEIVKKFPKTVLIIAGSGSEEKNLQLMAYSLQLQDNIKFEGWVEDLASYYKSCDAYLLCSNYEGYGMTLIMAQSVGCPIITTDVGVVGETINKDNALIVPVGDKKAIVDSIIKLQTDSEFKINLGKKMQESIDSVRSKEEYLRKYKQSWEKI